MDSLGKFAERSLAYLRERQDEASKLAIQAFEKQLNDPTFLITDYTSHQILRARYLIDGTGQIIPDIRKYLKHQESNEVKLGKLEKKADKNRAVKEGLEMWKRKQANPDFEFDRRSKGYNLLVKEGVIDDHQMNLNLEMKGVLLAGEGGRKSIADTIKECSDAFEKAMPDERRMLLEM